MRQVLQKTSRGAEFLWKGACCLINAVCAAQSGSETSAAAKAATGHLCMDGYSLRDTNLSKSRSVTITRKICLWSLSLCLSACLSLCVSVCVCVRVCVRARARLRAAYLFEDAKRPPSTDIPQKPSYLFLRTWGWLTGKASWSESPSICLLQPPPALGLKPQASTHVV